jgi:hypothetical protein
MRESRDNTDHPNSIPIAIFLDVTGSNITQAHIVHKKLPDLFKLLVAKRYVADPQIMMAAVGDAYCDRFPLQAGQFESDNRIDEALVVTVLEGGGSPGAQDMCESYELAAYFLARHTATDAWDKRHRKGYCFFIADETPYPTVRAAHIQKLIGDNVEADVPTKTVFAELQEKFDTYLLFLEANYGDRARRPWQDLLGENVINLPNAENVCEAIAGIIGIREENVDLDGVVADVGGTAGKVIGKSLAKVAKRNVTSKAAVDDVVRL